MGKTNFLVPRPDRIQESTLRQCYMQGIDGIPWMSKNCWDGRLLSIQRTTSESGQLMIPWLVPGRGRLTLSTTCLRESEEAYHLPVELARGTVGRTRNQVALWELNEMDVPAEARSLLAAASRTLGAAANMQCRSPDDAARTAEQAIQESLRAVDLLITSYHRAVLGAGKRNTLLGVPLGTRPVAELPGELAEAINTAIVPFTWSEVEGSQGSDSLEIFEEQMRWCREQGLRLCGGPLLDFGPEGFPDWLYLWEEDFDALHSYMLRYVHSVAERFAGKVNLWHAWAGLNCGQTMALSEEFRLRMGVASVELLRQMDARTPIFVSFDQPWGEYLARQSLDLAPIHYADTLVRADLGIAGFGLEINLGYWPYGSLPRDQLELSRLIDRWSTLGLPLVILLRIPSSPRPADSIPDASPIELMPTNADQLTAEQQAELAVELVRTCLAKPAVQGVIWNQLVDGDANHYPHAGLFTRGGAAKPILAGLKEIRQSYLA